MKFCESGKLKALTFSYDDGITQDIRLIELLNKYGIKATFNLNSDLLGKKGMLIRPSGMRLSHYKIHPEDVKFIYEGHEIAAHTLTHPRLPDIEDDAEVLRQVEKDRLQLCELAGYEVVGLAYPCGGKNNDERVADIIKKQTGIKYARTITSNGSFDVQSDLYRFDPTDHHMNFDKLTELAEKFIEMKPDRPQIFYIWGHSYELDAGTDCWGRLEEFFKLISGKDDIFYGTNKDILL